MNMSVFGFERKSTFNHKGCLYSNCDKYAIHDMLNVMMKICDMYENHDMYGKHVYENHDMYGKHVYENHDMYGKHVT